MTAPPVIVPYSEDWPYEYQSIFVRLHDVLGTRALRIEHVGSTAVPGLAAKDVIDVQVSVADLDGEVGGCWPRKASARSRTSTATTRRPVRPLGRTTGARDSSSQPEGQRRIHVHLRQVGRPNERFAILFRDYLRAYPQAAQAYAEFKRRLSAVAPSIEAYADVKDPVADLVMQAAERWRPKAAGASTRRRTFRRGLSGVGLSPRPGTPTRRRPTAEPDASGVRLPRRSAPPFPRSAGSPGPSARWPRRPA